VKAGDGCAGSRIDTISAGHVYVNKSGARFHIRPEAVGRR
jgi:hypothetical protein